MVRGYLYFFVLVIGIVSLISIGSGQLCDPGSDVSCGLPIDTDGQGAVQLCEDCFVCGASDGVCPEDFASNEPETVFERTVVQMRTDTTPFIDNPYDNPVIYYTGNLACANISGNCSVVEQNNNGTWESSGFSCSDTVTQNGLELRARCTDVPRTAACYNCPDPDCITEVRGLLYNSDYPDEGVDDALIIFKPVNPESPQRFEGRTNNLGLYSFNEAPRGNFTYECLKVNYEPYYGQAFLIRGENIVDCPMRPAACEDNPMCSMFDVDGQPVCRATCEGEAGCVFNQTIEVERYQDTPISVNASTLCDGRRAGAAVTVARHNETHVTAIQCCTGIPTYIERPQLQITGQVTDLITRDFVRILDDEQVNVKIIVYKTD